MNPKISVKALVVRKRKILLLKPRKLEGSIKGWDGPGGHLKMGETLIGALKREVVEETGLKIRKVAPVKFLPVFQNNTDYLIFLCNVHKGKVILSKEHTTFKWVNLKKFENITGINLGKELIDIKRLIRSLSS